MVLKCRDHCILGYTQNIPIFFLYITLVLTLVLVYVMTVLACDALPPSPSSVPTSALPAVSAAVTAVPCDVTDIFVTCLTGGGTFLVFPSFPDSGVILVRAAAQAGWGRLPWLLGKSRAELLSSDVEVSDLSQISDRLSTGEGMAGFLVAVGSSSESARLSG